MSDPITPAVDEFEVGGPAYRQDNQAQIDAGVPEGYKLAPDGLYRRRVKVVIVTPTVATTSVE